jgi:hypothetical protein
MTVRAPAPLAAAVGLAAASIEGAVDQLRRLPTLLGTAREKYDELAEHGRDVLAGHRGPVTGAAPATRTEPAPPVEVSPPVPDGVGAPASTPEPAPVGQLDPVPPLGRTEPVTVSEEVLAEVAELAPGDEVAAAELPLPDFDHQTVPQLRGRLRSLTVPELVQLRDYEQAHGRRLPVLTLLDNRIAKLAEES